MKLVKVTWDDTTTITEWRSIDDIKLTEPVHIVSVGLLIHESDKAIWILGMHNVQEDFASMTQIIPKGCILNIEEIKEV